MRLTIAKTLKKGDTVKHWQTGKEIVLQCDAEHHIVDRLVIVTDAFDGRRYIHTEIIPSTSKPKKTSRAVVYYF